ncbi:NUDIX domain-containing protein [Frankia sp. AgKG'84/4]|nr:NUDIX domain-containing protein [Frankia sp. AgKG'84/4]
MVCHEDGTILGNRRRDTGGWQIPGGVLERGETCQQGLCREIAEETGAWARSACRGPPEPPARCRRHGPAPRMGRSGPSRSGPSRSGPSRSGPSRSGPSRSGPIRANPGRSGPVRRSRGRSAGSRGRGRCQVRAGVRGAGDGGPGRAG